MPVNPDFTDQRMETAFLQKNADASMAKNITNTENHSWMTATKCKQVSNDLSKSAVVQLTDATSRRFYVHAVLNQRN